MAAAQVKGPDVVTPIEDVMVCPPTASRKAAWKQSKCWRCAAIRWVEAHIDRPLLSVSRCV
jgi:hypothetical protein